MTSDSHQELADATTTRDAALDVAAEMYRIRSEVRRQHPPVPKADWAQIQHQLRQVNTLRNVREMPFESSTPVVGPLLAALRSAWNSISTKWHVRRILMQQNAYNSAVANLLVSLHQELGSARPELSRLRQEQADLNADLAEQMRNQQAQRRTLEARVRALEQSLTAPDQEGQARVSAPRSSLDLDREGDAWNYLDFNRAFTAPDAVIREMYRPYLPLFAAAGPVLDAGCGTGCFLELLQQAGIEGYGVDREAEMVEVCRLKGLRVEKGDLLAHLAGLPPASLGGIFCGHLVEHLEIGALQRFLALAYECLRPGAVLVCETPNTRSLFVMANTYYRDPTHAQPLHPETLKFLAESCGFAEVELRYASSLPDAIRAAPLAVPEGSDPDLGRALVELNDRLERVNQQLFAHQNLAVVARKPLIGA